MNKKQKKMLIRIIIAAVLIVVFSLLPAEGYLRFVLFMIPYLVIGYDILKKAFKGILNKQVFDENFLMAVATVGAILLGDYSEGVAVMLFYQIGELFQSYAVGKSRRNISELMDIRPDYANIEKDGTLEQVDPDEVEIGTIIVVQPGEKVPIDGVITEGTSTLNTSALTGESLPRDAKAGDEVISGCINMTGLLKIRTTKEFGESTVSKILELVENSSSRKSRSENFISKFAKYYTPAVCYGALALAFIPPIVLLIMGKSAMWGDWIYRALTFLVISCPCALGLATPVAIMVGNGVGARRGVLFKNAVSLEQAGKIQIMALDKTGTITMGQPQVTDIYTAEGVEKEQAFQTAVEKAVEEKIKGNAPMKKAKDKKINTDAVTDFRVLPGNGVQAVWKEQTLLGGSLHFIRKQMKVEPELAEVSDHMAEQGKTPLLFAKNNQVIGILGVEDTVKEDSKEAIEALKEMGITTVMLTGDNEKTARAIAEKVGVDHRVAGVLPDGKEQVIRQLKKQGTVAMVGDGINDAPALVQADIGIAIGAGTDVAVDAADIVLMKSNLMSAVEAVRLSQSTLKNIHENLFWAFFYNVLGIPLAAGVFYPLFGILLNPMFGAAAMSLSSFCVVSNALRLNWSDPSKRKRKKYKKEVEVRIQQEGDRMNKIIEVKGMMCGHCEATVKKALEELPQVEEAKVSHTDGQAIVILSEEVEDDILKKVIEDHGYQVTKMS